MAFSGELNDGDKSAILDILRENVSNVAEVPNYVRFQIIDGRVMIYMIKPDPGSTFDKFVDKIYHYLDGRLKR